MTLPRGGGQRLNIMVVKEGFISESLTITPYAGSKWVENVTLQELSNTLVVQTFTADLQLKIDQDQRVMLSRRIVHFTVEPSLIAVSDCWNRAQSKLLIQNLAIAAFDGDHHEHMKKLI